MRNKRDNLAYVQDIRDAIEKIIKYVTAHSIEEFTSDEWDQAAAIRQFEIIGEATTNIDADFKKIHSDIEWRDMNDFRNFLIHDYSDIDIAIVWDAMTKHIPPLKKKIKAILLP